MCDKVLVVPIRLMTFDLNSPEDNAKAYGPYPVNRAVIGLKGNAKLLLQAENDLVSAEGGAGGAGGVGDADDGAAGCVEEEGETKSAEAAQLAETARREAEAVRRVTEAEAMLDSSFTR